MAKGNQNGSKKGLWSIFKEKAKEYIVTTIITGIGTLVVAIGAIVWAVLKPWIITDLPSGLIAAYEGSKCPVGWEVFSSAEGRFLMGASNATQTSPVDFLTAADLKLNNKGGTRVVNIEYPLPVQSQLKSMSMAAMADASVIFATDKGSGARYYVLPPYLTVTYCKKL